MPRRNSKRILVFSPPSAVKGKKVREASSSVEIEALIHAERGMETEKANSTDIDVSEIHETILTRVNEALKSTTSGSPSEEYTSFVKHIIPAIVTSVALAVGQVVKGHLDKFATEDTERRRNVESRDSERVRCKLLQLKYENDRLEQYTRRENVRFVGVEEGSGEQPEDLERKIITVCKDAGVEVTPEDFAAVHRVGKRGEKRQVIARFVSRKKRNELMRKKKNLKDKAEYAKTYVNEDLTPLRSKLLNLIKKAGRHSVWTVEGRLLCVSKRPPGVRNNDERPTVIESPDDLFRIGFDSVDMAELGLEDFLPEES